MINPNVRSRITSTDKHVGLGNRRRVQKRMKIRGDRLKGARHRRAIAPPIGCAIVPAGASDLAYLTLNCAPAVAGHVPICIEDNARAPFAGAKDIERAPADVYGPAYLRVPPPILAFAGLLINNPAED